MFACTSAKGTSKGDGIPAPSARATAAKRRPGLGFGAARVRHRSIRAERSPKTDMASATSASFSEVGCLTSHADRSVQTARRVTWPKTMQRTSPAVGFMPPSRSWCNSSAMRLASWSGVRQRPWRAVAPVERQTKTVSTIDDPVPWMWIEPPISAGQGSAAEQVRPASRIATATAWYA